MISWQENLQEKEVPPAWMWPFEEQLETWFEKVKKDRDQEFGSHDNDDDDDDDDSDEFVPNEYAAALRRLRKSAT